MLKVGSVVYTMLYAVLTDNAQNGSLVLRPTPFFILHFALATTHRMQ